MYTKETARIHVYCGPTITPLEVTQILPAAKVHPPIRHGDLLMLEVCRGDIVVIIDGVFYQTAPVRHKEILYLLEQGVTVVGAASMGALRAAELQPYGMIGLGTVYSAYRKGLIDADDEVAVAHDPGDHRQLSNALVDIRAAILLARDQGVVSGFEATALLEHFRALHFTSRTWTTRSIAIGAGQPSLDAVLERLAHWRASQPGWEDAKHRDAREALQLIAAGALPRGDRKVDWSATSWKNQHQAHWIARFCGPQVEGVRTPFLAILQHQQLYDPGFPCRWRRHVLAWIVNSHGYSDIEARALAMVGAKGLSLQRLSADQIGYWLTDTERTELDDDEKMLRILVRSVPNDSTSIWPIALNEAEDLINPDIDSTRAVAVAFRYNAEIARSDPGRTVYHLRADRLFDHLAQRWHIDGQDRPSLTAAARDRGFREIGNAVDAARSFLLAAAHE